MRVCGITVSHFFTPKTEQSIENTGFSEGAKKWPLFQKFFSCFSVFSSVLRIVSSVLRKHYATAWHSSGSRSHDSCGFAGSASIVFCGLNRRKALVLLGFSSVPRNGTLRRNFFEANRNKCLSLICSEMPDCTPYFRITTCSFSDLPWFLQHRVVR